MWNCRYCMIIWVIEGAISDGWQGTIGLQDCCWMVYFSIPVPAYYSCKANINYMLIQSIFAWSSGLHSFNSFLPVIINAHVNTFYTLLVAVLLSTYVWSEDLPKLQRSPANLQSLNLALIYALDMIQTHLRSVLFTESSYKTGVNSWSRVKLGDNSSLTKKHNGVLNTWVALISVNSLWWCILTLIIYYPKGIYSGIRIELSIIWTSNWPLN